MIKIKTYITLTPIVIICQILLSLQSCNNHQAGKHENTKKDQAPMEDNVSIVNIPRGYKTRIGESVKLRLSIKENVAADSFALFVDGKRTFGGSDSADLILETSSLRPGIRTLTLYSFVPGKRKEADIVALQLLSDMSPIDYEYKIINVFPHDKKAYTQGLFRENDVFYESTGQWGESSLRKVDITTGKVLQSYKVDNSIFAEGMVVVGDKIYQITYKAQKAFVYDKKSFQLLNTFTYPNLEGWGLTYDGQDLLMSDGTEKIYRYDPATFTQKSYIEVYDHQGPVYRLNELEYINGMIYSNVYGENYIVIIEPASGKVTGKLDFSSILEEKDRHPSIDVFNGIAWNEEKNHLYVTGKYWPKLFEVKMIKR